jgi:multiple sugar transport system permease protein
MNASKRGAKDPGDMLLTVVAIAISLIGLTPIIWFVFVSIQREGTPIRSVTDWFRPPYTFVNYTQIIFASRIPSWMWNSFLISTAGTFLTLLFSSLAAYPLAKISFYGRNKLYFYFILGLLVPGEATIVPLFIVANNLNMIDTYAGMILPGVAGSMNLLIMVTFFRGIPNELIEVCHIDGAREITIFTRIMLPLSRTVLVTVSIFSFIGNWNNFLWPLLCAMSQRMFTLTVGIPTLMNTYTVDYTIPATANMVASIPAIIVFLIFERQITQGIAMSGIKG